MVEFSRIDVSDELSRGTLGITKIENLTFFINNICPLLGELRILTVCGGVLSLQRLWGVTIR